MSSDTMNIMPTKEMQDDFNRWMRLIQRRVKDVPVQTAVLKLCALGAATGSMIAIGNTTPEQKEALRNAVVMNINMAVLGASVQGVDPPDMQTQAGMVATASFQSIKSMVKALDGHPATMLIIVETVLAMTIDACCMEDHQDEQIDRLARRVKDTIAKVRLAAAPPQGSA